MKKHFKSAILFVLITIMLFSSFSCKEKDNRVTVDKTLADILMEEAQLITDFIRDEGFIYGDARINPAFNWEFLDKEKVSSYTEKSVRLSVCLFIDCRFAHVNIITGGEN